MCACVVCVRVRVIRRDWSTQEGEAGRRPRPEAGGLARCPCAGSSGRPPQRGRAAGPRASTRCSPRGWPRRPRLRLRTRPGGCAATGEFYAVPPDEARELRALQVVDPISYEPIPAGAARDDDDATFRLPFPESAPKNADGSYQYRLYDAAGLWNWVRAPGRAYDPLDRTKLLRSDWEALRDRYSSAAANPTPALSAFRRPITSGLWPPGVPYVPPPPPPPLTDATIRQAVRDALAAGGPEYAHPGHGPIAGWDVRNVTDMSVLFYHAAAFNGDLGGWDVRNVTDMISMFQGAAAFNGDLSGWDVSAVTNMSGMFFNAASFNGDLGGWDVRNVTDMCGMFWNAAAFNADLGGWDVRNVTDMSSMFEGAASFNGDLGGWDVRNVTGMNRMFCNAAAFNGDLSGWDVRNVTDMSRMFERAASFNGDLSGWDVRNVTDMSGMFWNAAAFNGDLGGWDVRNVTNMSGMFFKAAAFNGDLSGWDVRNVTDMGSMFLNTPALNPKPAWYTGRG